MKASNSKLFKYWDLSVGIYLEFGIWYLEF